MTSWVNLTAASLGYPSGSLPSVHLADKPLILS